MPALQSGALRQYQNTAVIDAASADIPPQQLIAMLLSGALERLNTARGCILGGDLQRKAPLIASASAIIEHLRLCLDRQAGGEIARNLDALYDYMGRRLLRANLDNDAAGVDEVAGLLRTIKAAWDDVGRPGPRPLR